MSTLDYYNTNAAAFAADTLSADLHETQDRFLALLPSGAAVLDFGCGAGRDSLYFASRGLAVTPVDGSEALCRLVRERTGLPVRQMLFSELNDAAAYDGIWACASILHLTKTELREVFPKMITALCPNGILYVSFKYGTLEGMRGERYYTDFTEETFQTFIAEFPMLHTEQQWITADVRPNRGEEKWLNCILRLTEVR